jgi:phenylpropionate dioxygenase-like ring-hydroxylating dioxygenase large terminal subunit
MAVHAVKERRYSLPPYTRGWFAIAWSDDLRVGQVKKIRQFGRTFTLFRGEDGKAGVIDDVCPHLGAHFSDGGSVQGNSVRCTYHHWCFDRGGECTSIPYAKKIPTKARVKSYEVVERYGMIFMYRDKDGNRPTYALPEIEDFVESQYEKPEKFVFAIRIHGQDIMENSVDSAHFRAVHGHETPENRFLSEGKELRITQIVTLKRFMTVLKGHLDFHMIEPGFHYVHFPEVIKMRALVFSSIVPIDEEMINHRLAI